MRISKYVDRTDPLIDLVLGLQVVIDATVAECGKTDLCTKIVYVEQLLHIIAYRQSTCQRIHDNNTETIPVARMISAK